MDESLLVCEEMSMLTFPKFQGLLALRLPSFSRYQGFTDLCGWVRGFWAGWQDTDTVDGGLSPRSGMACV